MRKLEGPELLFVGCGGNKSVKASDMEELVYKSLMSGHQYGSGWFAPLFLFRK